MKLHSTLARYNFQLSPSHFPAPHLRSSLSLSPSQICAPHQRLRPNDGDRTPPSAASRRSNQRRWSTSLTQLLSLSPSQTLAPHKNPPSLFTGGRRQPTATSRKKVTHWSSDPATPRPSITQRPRDPATPSDPPTQHHPTTQQPSDPATHWSREGAPTFRKRVLSSDFVVVGVPLFIPDMEDWNKPFTDEELVAIDASFEAAAASSLHLKTSHTSRPFSGNMSLAPTLCSTKWPFYQGCGKSQEVHHTRKSDQSMALHGRTKKRPLEQHVRSSTNRLHMKRPRMPVAVVESQMVRKWDEMYHDILVTIMKYMVQGSYLVQGFNLYRPFNVCKSWRSAVLDSLFPPGNVLDLRFLEDVPRVERQYYLFYLKFLLRRPHQYTKLFIPLINFRGEADIYIAQRLPKLKCIVQPTRILPFRMIKLIPYWPELHEAHCHASLIPLIRKHCKNIKRLDLSGRIGDDKAYMLAFHFPQLVHLSIQSCILSPNALSIILQGRPDLTYLDTRHAFCIKGFLHGPIIGKVIALDEDEVGQKAVGIKTYLHCARKYCSYCAPLYSPNISREDLFRFATM